MHCINVCGIENLRYTVKAQGLAVREFNPNELSVENIGNLDLTSNKPNEIFE